MRNRESARDRATARDRESARDRELARDRETVRDRETARERESTRDCETARDSLIVEGERGRESVENKREKWKLCARLEMRKRMRKEREEGKESVGC